MSQEAIIFKKNNPNLNHKTMHTLERNKLPVYSGVIDFAITESSFKMLCILNDDSSIVKFFWQGSHDLDSLDLWYKITKNEGIYIDIGAHTGLYTITALKANPNNKVISIEPYYLNMARLSTNLRLNNLEKNVQKLLLAVSNVDGILKFKVKTNNSYLSKGGKIADEGEPIKAIKLDSIDFTKIDKKINALKIDTEGEDLKVLEGAINLIKKFKPKIIIEVREKNKKEIQNILEKINYKFYNVNNLKDNINLTYYKIDNVLNIFADSN